MDEGAADLLAVVGSGGPRHVEAALEMDRDHRVPVALGHLVEDAVPQDAGVVHDAVDLAELVQRLFDDPSGAVEVGDALVVRGGASAGCLDLGDDGLGRCLVAAVAALGTAEVVDDDGSAVGSGKQRDVAADAAARAGDGDHLLVQHACVHFRCLQSQAAAMAAMVRQPSRYSWTSTYSSTVWGLCWPAPRVTVGRPLAFR